MIGVTLLAIAMIGQALQSALNSYEEAELPGSVAVVLLSSIYYSMWMVEPIALWLLLTPEQYGAIRPDRTAKSAVLRIIAVTCSLRFTSIPDMTPSSIWSPQLVRGLLSMLIHVLVFFRLRELARRGDARLVKAASVVMAVNIAALLFGSVAPASFNMFRSTPFPDVPRPLMILLGSGVTIFTAAIWWKFRRMLVDAAEKARDNWPIRMDRSQV